MQTENKKIRPLTDKYRPRKLSQVVGQNVAVSVIRGMMETGRIPSTILIEGPFGCGKTSLARIIGRYVNCSHEKGPDECDGCPSCDAFKNGSHPCIHEVDAGDMRGIDNIRNLKMTARFAPVFKRNIYILDECQGLTADAWRSALKLFEEPPKATIFILLTNEPQKLPPTIQDRCVQISLKEPSAEVIAKYIGKIAEKEKFEIDQDSCTRIAQAADGHVRSAVRLLEQIMLYAKSGQDNDDFVKDLPTIIQKALGLPSDKIVGSYVKAIISGDLAEALSVITFIKDNDLSSGYFLQLVISSLRNHIFARLAMKLVDGRYFRAVSSVKDALAKWRHKELVNLFGIYLQAYEKMKLFVLPARELLDYVTLQALDLYNETAHANLNQKKKEES